MRFGEVDVGFEIINVSLLSGIVPPGSGKVEVCFPDTDPAEAAFFEYESQSDSEA